ncbi:MAG: TRAP transporter large permease subunit [Planctomycetes bacterium]|nr:TRAP transporter large permease subunit [Planctomycetota bacterium]
MGLPLFSFSGRLVLGTSSAAAIPLAQHACLLLAFAGALVAAREKKLLRLGGVGLLERVPMLRALVPAANAVACATTGLLARAALELVGLEREFLTQVAGLFPLWPLLLVLPLAFLGIGLRLALGDGISKGARVAALLALALAVALGGGPLLGAPAWPAVALVILAAFLGAPLYVPLAGAALFLFLASGSPGDPYPGAAVPTEMLQLATSPFLPAIPLFTLAGLLLTEGAARRLLAVFRAFFGWLPGGTAVVCTLLCAFFSIFTGGSGVTILALGGLLFQTLKSDGYREDFSLGLITGASALGILLPPALPLILFGIAAQVPIDELFRGGILPGLLMVVLVTLAGMRAGVRARIPLTPFRLGAAFTSLWRAKLELALPLITLGLLFSGRATLLEAAAGTVLYAFVVQVLVQRELAWRALPGILRECGALIGGVLILLCAAKGLSSYFVDAQVPTRLLALVQEHVESRWVFLLVLNGFLLVVGCFLDIYSATFVIVPLLLELGRAYGIDPVHLGILFIANLELGYLTPPVGLNLFLASYRFQKPLLTVARASLPMMLILGLGVLLITYVPWLTTALAR